LLTCRPCFVILRLIVKSAKVANRVITNEITFPAKLGLVRHRFNSHDCHAAGASGVKRNDRHIRRPAFGGRPLHPPEAERTSFEKVPTALSRPARFPPP